MILRIFFLSICCQIIFSCNQKSTSEKSGPTIFFNAKNEINLDGLHVGKNITKLVEFTNTGNKPLIVSDVKSTCGCTVASITKDAIPPKGKGFINLEIKPDVAGFFQKAIIIEANTLNPLSVLYVQGMTEK